MFAAYIPGYGDAIAQGGRYDETGAVFGRARPATGFSADLKVLARAGDFAVADKATIIAPADNDPALWARISELRKAGRRVVVAMTQDDVQGNAQLLRQDGKWQLVE